MPGITKNKSFCCVFGCSVSQYKNPGESFHLFPPINKYKTTVINKFGIAEAVDAHKAWLHALKMGKPARKFMRVCSNHFSHNDYFSHGGPVQRRRLKQGVVPSQNLPKSSQNRSPHKSRALLAAQRIARKARRTLHTCNEEMDGPEDIENPLPNATESELRAAYTLLDLQFPTASGSSSEVEKTDKAVQVQSGDLYNRFCDKLSNEAKLNSFTSVPSFEILEVLVDLVRPIIRDRRIHRLSVQDRVIMTMMKLKLNVSYAVLSVIFGEYTPTHCRTEFKRMVIALSVALEPAIPWPSREEISRNLPACFSSFKLARVVLDCTEVAVQKPKCLPCRLKLYSQYKSGLTLKWMTGISPGGLITFKSKAYGGRASDSTIFNQSGLLQKLEKQDCIMIDKGFLVDVPCFDHGIDIIRPTFLRGKTTFSKEEALNNRDISRARVHVERANARIKSLKFFSHKFEWSQIAIVDAAFTIVCGLVNLTSPLLADDKF